MADFEWTTRDGVELYCGTADEGYYYIGNYYNDSVALNGTDGRDFFDNMSPGGIGSAYVTIHGGYGNDTMHSQAYSGGSGDRCVFYGEEDNDSIWAQGEYLRAFGGDGKDTIYIGGSNAGIDGGSDDDNIQVSGSNALVNGNSGDDTIYVTNGYILGDDGNDSIKGSGTLEGGSGNDTIEGSGNIEGNSGNDVIVIYNSNKATVDGGGGDDKISLGRYSEALIKFYDGEGNDVVYSFNSKSDTLEIVDSSYATLYSQTDEQSQTGLADITFKLDDGSITLKDLNISDVEENPLKIIGTYDGGTSSGGEETSTGGGGTLTGYSYSGGNMSISNYAGEKIFYSADFNGIGFNDTDFIINSSSGSLTLQNVRDKVIDVADTAGNTAAYVFMASGGGDINFGGLSPFEVIIGGNNSSNTITAGLGGSSLWGGSGAVSDVMIGGAGIDNFFAGKSDGSDIIINASENDLIFLYDVSLSDVTAFNVYNNFFSIGFNTGNVLTVYDNGDKTPTMQLADGNRYAYNRATGEWT